MLQKAFFLSLTRRVAGFGSKAAAQKLTRGAATRPMRTVVVWLIAAIFSPAPKWGRDGFVTQLL